MPGGLSRLLIRAFVHRPFRNGNDRWRGGRGTVHSSRVRTAVKGTENFPPPNDTRFLYLRDPETLLRFASPIQPIFPDFRFPRTRTTSDIRSGKRSPVRRERAEEVWRERERTLTRRREAKEPAVRGTSSRARVRGSENV